jgi:hypothetical protein
MRENEDELGKGVDYFESISKNGIEDEYRISGFSKKTRMGYEKKIANYVFEYIKFYVKVANLEKKYLIDIGSGSGSLSNEITKELHKLGMIHVMNDINTIIQYATKEPNRIFVEGKFPDSREELIKLKTETKIILCYSSLQYIYNDEIEDIFFDFLTDNFDSPETLIYFGDIPNKDTRNRKKINSGLDRDLDSRRKIGDEEVEDIFKRFHDRDYEVFKVPQPRFLPLSQHRHDVIVFKPGKYEK